MADVLLDAVAAEAQLWLCISSIGVPESEVLKF
jgi:hypothetical protein